MGIVGWAVERQQIGLSETSPRMGFGLTGLADGPMFAMISAQQWSAGTQEHAHG